MKIAILTLPLHTNYGGLLQAYALQTVLERMGHEVEHLQPEVTYPPLHHAWQMPLVWGKRLIRKYLGGDSKLPIFEHPRRWVRKNTDKFIAENIRCRYLKPEDWGEILADEYDAFVVGSDQVWRPCMSGYIERYLTGFLGDKKVDRFAYAASFGVDDSEFSKDQIQKLKPLLSKFNAVSVRELSGIELCYEMFGISAECTLDPTMLLNVEEYVSISNRAKHHDKCIMTYLLDNSSDIDAFVERLASKYHLDISRTNSMVEMYYRGKVRRLSECQQPPVEKWLRTFRDAELVITDSFHACVFSIIFNKPFLCIGNDFRGLARINSLLGQFGLMDRLVSIDSDHIPSSDIDWTKVNAILDEKRRKSLDFLRQALGN